MSASVCRLRKFHVQMVLLRQLVKAESNAKVQSDAEKTEDLSSMFFFYGSYLSWGAKRNGY